jgi:hypothetical protein
MNDPMSASKAGIAARLKRGVEALWSLVRDLGRVVWRALLKVVWPSYAASLSLRERVSGAVVVFLFVLVAWVALAVSFMAGRVFAEHGNKLFGNGPTVSDLQSSVTELSQRLATEQAQREIERATYAKVAHDLAELQSQINEQNEELGFYRSVMTPKNLPNGIKIQKIKILPTENVRKYNVQMVMIGDNRSAAVEQVVAELSVEGVRNNVPVVLPMERLNPSTPKVNFVFRYFDEQQVTLELPADFYPKHVVIEARGTHANGVLKQSFPWRVQPM